MAKQRMNPAQKAIEAASKRKPFAAPESGLNQRVRTSLLALGKSHAELAAHFATRATGRQQQAAAARNASLVNALADLEHRRKGVADVLTLGNKSLIATAKAQQTFAERHVDMVRQDKVSNALIEIANIDDDHLRAWHDEVVLLAVQALSEDTASDKAIGVLSGGLILVGVAAGPVAAAAAAIASAALLVGDLRAKGNKILETDRDVARRERAIVLLDFAKGIADHWLTIL